MNSGTVYVVDDDASVRDSLSLLLQLHGFRPLALASAAEFLASYAPDAAACALIDLRMPRMDGLALQQELMRRQWHLPCIVMSAYGDVSTTRQALKAGAFDFLEKPLDDTQLLLDVISNALRQDEARREAGARTEELRNRYARLTPRECEVMKLLSNGLAHREIGVELGISPRTVEVYRARLFEKLQIRSITELVRAHDSLTAGNA